MKICPECLAELNKASKFCTKCGYKFEDNQANAEIENKSEKILISKKIEAAANKAEKINNSHKIHDACTTKKGFSKSIKLIITISLVLLLSGAGITAYYLITKNTPKDSITIKSITLDKYPNVKIEFNISGFEGGLSAENFSVKENDIYQNNIKLNKKGTGYILEYPTTNTSITERKVAIQCSFKNKNYDMSTNYSSPRDDISDGNINSNSNVSTFNNDESAIKSSIDNYEYSFIRMVNYRDISYITSSLDGDSPLKKEFESMLKEYSAKQITESLEEYKINTYKKISDTQYEVIVYEKFLISYGIQNDTKVKEFVATYVVNKNATDFKVHSISNYSEKK